MDVLLGIDIGHRKAPWVSWSIPRRQSRGRTAPGYGTRLVPADSDWARMSREIVADAGHGELDDDLYSTWLQLYPTRSVVHGLADQPIV